MPPKQTMHLDLSNETRKRLGKVPGKTLEEKVSFLLEKIS